MEKHIKESRWMSYALRHDQSYADACMDDEGYVYICDLVRHAVHQGIDLNYAMIEEIVRTDDKSRYSIAEGDIQRTSMVGIKQVYMKIRANQGHSITKGPKLKEVTPPEYLYHGTAIRFVDSIYEKGILKQTRTHVHLSTDGATAIDVGARHGTAVVIIVHAKKMATDGHKFYVSDNGVWLTEHVPAKYIL